MKDPSNQRASRFTVWLSSCVDRRLQAFKKSVDELSNCLDLHRSAQADGNPLRIFVAWIAMLALYLRAKFWSCVTIALARFQLWRSGE